MPELHESIPSDPRDDAPPRQVPSDSPDAHYRALTESVSGMIEAIADPFVVQDGAWRFRHINGAAAKIFSAAGRTTTDLTGAVLWEAYPDIVGTGFEREMRRAMETRQAVSFEEFYPERGEWIQLFCYPLPDGGLATQWRNVTERKKAEEAAHYLSRATAVLGSSLDYEVTLAALARLVVPELADWCAVDIATDDGGLQRLAVAHDDPEKVNLARELHRRYPPEANPSSGVLKVIRSGIPELYADITTEMVTSSAIDDEHRRILLELGLRSAIVVPLTARDRTLGALTLVSAESRRRYRQADLDLTMELGRRAGLAVENSRLFAEARSAADRIARLQAVTAGLASALSPVEVEGTVIREGCAALGAVTGALFLLTPDGEQFELVQNINVHHENVRQYQRFASSLSLPLADAIRSHEVLYIDRDEALRRYPQLHDVIARSNGSAWCAIPLFTRETPIGAIVFGLPKARDFSVNDRAFALALAQQASQAIERARLYDAEKAARAEAEAANRAKSEFLATMSHELRTPLNAIAGYAELIDFGVHGPITDAQREALRRIQRSRLHLQSLIEEILSFARIEAGRLLIDAIDIRVRDLLIGLEPLIAPQVRAKGLTLAMDECDPTLHVRGDEEKVRQILINLLANAIKFTPAGGRISVGVDSLGDQVALYVRDSGIGIPAEKLGAIFEPFIQLARPTSPLRDGLGLGLSISRDLARAMGGDLTVSSEVGVGSQFTLVLQQPIVSS